MSAESQSYVEKYSPYSGDTYAVHLRMGILANDTYQYRLFSGDKYFAHLCRCSVKTVQRAREKMIADGFLELIKPAVGHEPAEYQFVFKKVGGHSDSNSEVGGHSDQSRWTSEEDSPIYINKEINKEPSPTKVVGGRKNKKNEYTPEFEEIWKIYPRRDAKVPAFTAFKARLKQGESLEELTLAVKNYIVVVKDRLPEHILQGGTFFGTNERWKDYLDTAPSDASLSPDQKNVALIFDCYDQGGEWFDFTTEEFLLDNPVSFGYNRPRDARGNMVDADGKPYKMTAQGQRVRLE